jgi:hypothetical protein
VHDAWRLARVLPPGSIRDPLGLAWLRREAPPRRRRARRLGPRLRGPARGRSRP